MTFVIIYGPERESHQVVGPFDNYNKALVWATQTEDAGDFQNLGYSIINPTRPDEYGK